MLHLVLHNYVHPPRARDAGLSPREERRVAEIEAKQRLTREELAELRDLKFLRGVPRGKDAALHVDVTYVRGPFGREERTSRHYVVEEPAGSAGCVSSSRHGPDAVRAELRKISEHRDMIRAGWTAGGVSGYNRDAGAEAEWLVEFTYADGSVETVRVRAPRENAAVERASWRRMMKNKRVEGVAAHEQLRLFDRGREDAPTVGHPRQSLGTRP